MAFTTSRLPEALIMSQDVLTKNEAVGNAKTEIHTTAVQSVCRPQEILDVLVEVVKRDSQNEATAFLAETTVPHGGE